LSCFALYGVPLRFAPVRKDLAGSKKAGELRGADGVGRHLWQYGFTYCHK